MKAERILIAGFFLTLMLSLVSAQPFCSDSDSGKDYNIKGIVTYDTPEGQNNVDDYCKTDTTLIEGYCDPDSEKLYKTTSTECDICACGRCFNEGEEITCEDESKTYCEDESCYIIEKDIGQITYTGKEILTEGCLVEEECVLHKGKYNFNNYAVQVFVEPNANINFGELYVVLKDKQGKKPSTESFRGSNYYLIKDGGDTLFIWISSDKIITLRISNTFAEKEENEDLEEFVSSYLEAHPSDIEENLNFFERIIDWFKNLFY